MEAESTLPVTTVFARVVHAGYESQYEEWLNGISRAAAAFPGNQGTTILRPSEGRKQYIAVVHFDSNTNQEAWLDSQERADWLSKLESISLDHEEVASGQGTERWFTLPGCPVTHAPPRYKTAIMVFVGLYPMSLLLNLTLTPALGACPPFLRLMLSQIVSIALMVYVLIPALTRLFYAWLYPRGVPVVLTSDRPAQPGTAPAS